MTDIDLILRLGLAVLLGGIIGFERERHKRAAGLRTHILVCVGSSLIVLTSIYMAEHFSGINRSCDPSRVAASIMTGIGFLGAGTIIRSRASVTGLTTAASIWGVAGIGMALGCGFFRAATYASVAIMVTLTLLGKFTKWYKDREEEDDE